MSNNKQSSYFRSTLRSILGLKKFIIQKNLRIVDGNKAKEEMHTAGTRSGKQLRNSKRNSKINYKHLRQTGHSVGYNTTVTM